MKTARAPEITIGFRVGRLVVAWDTGERKNGYRVWQCRCDCGQETLAVATQLTQGYKKAAAVWSAATPAGTMGCISTAGPKNGPPRSASRGGPITWAASKISTTRWPPARRRRNASTAASWNGTTGPIPGPDNLNPTPRPVTGCFFIPRPAAFPPAGCPPGGRAPWPRRPQESTGGCTGGR